MVIPQLPIPKNPLASTWFSTTRLVLLERRSTAAHHKQRGNEPAGHITHHYQSKGSKVSRRTQISPGQDAFGAIQEIISILESDPSTNWSRVDITKLRVHLVNMNLMMNTEVRGKDIKGGLEVSVTGKSQTLEAIQSMVTAHVAMIDGLNGRTGKAEKLTTGAKLIVTTKNASETAHIRGLGFYGLMVSGSHHQTHYLGVARGEAVHT